MLRKSYLEELSIRYQKNCLSNTSFYLLVPTCVEEVLACPSFNFGDTTSCCFTFTKPYPCINSPACHLYSEAPNSMCYRKAFQRIPSRHPWINKWRYHFYSSLDISYKRWEFHNNNKKEMEILNLYVRHPLVFNFYETKKLM